MFSIQRSAIPPNSLLYAYTTHGTYADAYSTEIVGNTSLPEYISVFYTSPLFRLERLILGITISRPSTDSQASQLADGDIDSFAAWRVEGRREDEILLCDISGRTRSWLKVVPVEDGSRPRTRIYFGSAVVPARNLKSGKSSLGFVFWSLLGFHQIYSVMLLYSAKLRIKHTRRVTMQTKELCE